MEPKFHRIAVVMIAALVLSGCFSGPDVGTQYRSVVFYHDDEQKTAAQKIIRDLNQSRQFDRPIATQVVPAAEFYPAEGYHQQYYEKMRRIR